PVRGIRARRGARRGRGVAVLLRPVAVAPVASRLSAARAVKCSRGACGAIAGSVDGPPRRHRHAPRGTGGTGRTRPGAVVTRGGVARGQGGAGGSRLTRGARWGRRAPWCPALSESGRRKVARTDVATAGGVVSS